MYLNAPKAHCFRAPACLPLRDLDLWIKSLQSPSCHLLAKPDRKISTCKQIPKCVGLRDVWIADIILSIYDGQLQ